MISCGNCEIFTYGKHFFYATLLSLPVTPRSGWRSESENEWISPSGFKLLKGLWLELLIVLSGPARDEVREEQRRRLVRSGEASKALMKPCK